MENEGWIKIWRKVKKNPIFKNDSLFKCWIYCLLEASHKEMELLISGQIVKITPGQFISGREKANKDLGWKGIKFDRKMQFLEKHGFLNRQVNRHFTLNTIINWDIYQGFNIKDEQVSEQELNNTRTAGEQRVNTYKNVKNDKNVKKKNILSDEDFLSSLKEKFTWINFDEIMVKMDAWLLAHPNRKKTRRFIVGWLNKIDKPLEIKNIKSKESPITKSPEWIKEAVERGWK